MLHTKLKCGAHDAKRNRSKYTQSPTRLHVLGGGGTGDNLDQLTGNGSLSGTVVQNLESVDHVTGVLGGVVHGVAASRLLTGVTLGKSLGGVSKLVVSRASVRKGVRTQKRELAREYSRRLPRIESSTSKEEMLADDEVSQLATCF